MAIASEYTSLPPRDLTSCVGIICNGEIEITSSLQERLRKCGTIIGVDGGLNHCKKMQITPHWVVGDCDSVDPVVLEEFKTSTSIISLPRAKDCTDLEAAIEKAKAISIHAQIIIWGGLGGRIDHTLSNIFLLFRHPARLFLESEQQILFAISDAMGEVEISHITHKTLALVPLNGPAKNVCIKSGDKLIDVPLIDKNTPYIFPFDKTCKLHVGSGEILVVLDQRKLSPLDILPQAAIPLKFSLDQPLIHILGYLAHQSLYFRVVRLFSDRESIFNIQSISGEVSFSSKKGQTISLIPLYGPASGIKTHGLKWELGEKTVDRLDKDFVGISNVSMGDSYSVAVGHGELLCIVNEELVDEELVEAKIE